MSLKAAVAPKASIQVTGFSFGGRFKIQTVFGTGSNLILFGLTCLLSVSRLAANRRPKLRYLLAASVCRIVVPRRTLVSIRRQFKVTSELGFVSPARLVGSELALRTESYRDRGRCLRGFRVSRLPLGTIPSIHNQVGGPRIIEAISSAQEAGISDPPPLP